jgi:hypothetical protein
VFQSRRPQPANAPVPYGPRRFSAALRAISLRCSGVNFAARACPSFLEMWVRDERSRTTSWLSQSKPSTSSLVGKRGGAAGKRGRRESHPAIRPAGRVGGRNAPHLAA